MFLSLSTFPLTPEEDAALREFEEQQKISKQLRPAIERDTVNYRQDKKIFVVISGSMVDSIQSIIDSLNDKYYNTRGTGGKKVLLNSKPFSIDEKIRYFDYLFKYSGLKLDSSKILSAIELLVFIYDMELYLLNKILDTQEGNSKSIIYNRIGIKRREKNKIDSYYLYRVK